MGSWINRFFASTYWRYFRVLILLVFLYSSVQLLVVASYAINLYNSLVSKISVELGESMLEITFWGTVTACALGFVCIAALADLQIQLYKNRRLRSLARTINRFAAGAMNERAQHESIKEIDVIGRAFNVMADQITAQLSELKENDRLRREMISHIAHDLGGPVTSIQGYSETLLIKDDSLPAEDRRKYLRVMHFNARALGKLVAELFDLARLDAREIIPQAETFSLETLILDVCSRFKAALEEKQIEFSIESHPSLPCVFADISLTERVISNLIENALRHTPSGGRIAVRYLTSNGLLHTSICDNGEGIPAADLPYVFDRFYRVDKGRSRTSGGAGLGLTIVKKIIESHGTNVTIESREGIGTTINFSLPVSDPVALNNDVSNDNR